MRGEGQNGGVAVLMGGIRGKGNIANVFSCLCCLVFCFVLFFVKRKLCINRTRTYRDL